MTTVLCNDPSHATLLAKKNKWKQRNREWEKKFPAVEADSVSTPESAASRVELASRKNRRALKAAEEEIQSLKEELQRTQQEKADREEAARIVSQTAIRREQELKDVNRNEVEDLKAQNEALRKSRNQLEERVRRLESFDYEAVLQERDRALVRYEELKRAHEVLPDRGPWLHRRGDITTSSYDEYINGILEDAQKILLDPNLFPFIWKERTGNDLASDEAEAWTRVESPF